MIGICVTLTKRPKVKVRRMRFEDLKRLVEALLNPGEHVAIVCIDIGVKRDGDG